MGKREQILELQLNEVVLEGPELGWEAQMPKVVMDGGGYKRY